MWSVIFNRRIFISAIAPFVVICLLRMKSKKVYLIVKLKYIPLLVLSRTVNQARIVNKATEKPDNSIPLISRDISC